MDPAFWLDKWTANQIGFHTHAPHPLLVRHWSSLGLSDGARVFVPLCGKSLDLIWLRDAGYTVIGIELSAIAVADFLVEHALAPARRRVAGMDCYSTPGLTLLRGDFFALDDATTGALDAVYDRAALIALGPDQRRAYADRLNARCAAGTRMLLITVDYDQTRISAPPFVVTDAEIDTLYGHAWSIRRLATSSAEVKGEAATETVFQLERNASDAQR